MKTAWLVKVSSGAVYMRAFTSYERAFKYYNEMVDIVEEHIEERNYEKVVSKPTRDKEIVTQFIYWNEDYRFRNTLGLVSIKEIEWEEE